MHLTTATCQARRSVSTAAVNYQPFPARHWSSCTRLPVVHQYKVMLLLFMVHSNHRCLYWREFTASVSSDPARQLVRFATASDYVVPQTRTKLADVAFCGWSESWKSLPESVRPRTRLTVLSILLILSWFYIVIPNRSVMLYAAH